MDHHAIVDPGIKLDLIPTDHLLQHPANNLLHIPAQPDHGADPAHPHVDGNQSASADDGNAHPGKVPHDPPAPTARSSDLSGDDSAQPFKTNLDHHAVDDPKTNFPSNSNNHPLQQPAHNSLHTPAQHHALHTPAQHHDHGSPAVTDGAHPGLGVDGIQSASPKFADDVSTHPGKVPHDPPAPTALSSDVSADDSAQPFHAVDDPETNSLSNSNNHPLQQPADNSLHTPAQHDDNDSPAVTDGAHPADLPVDVNQLASFKFADEGSADLGRLAHPHFDNAKVFDTVMSDAASDQFVFEKGHDKVADVKQDVIETDHAVAEIRHLLHTPHDANAGGALDPNHTTAPQDMTMVQLPHHHGDFHFA